MVIATTRAADIDVTRRPDGQIDNTYLWMWSAIEPPVGKDSLHRRLFLLQWTSLLTLRHPALVISCLSAVPALFRSSAISASRKPAFSPSETYLRMMSRIRSARSGGSSGRGGGKADPLTLADLSMVSVADGFDYVRAPDGPDGTGHGDANLSLAQLQQWQKQQYRLQQQQLQQQQEQGLRNPVLVPPGVYYQKPVVQCYRGEHGEQLAVAPPQTPAQERPQRRGGQIIQHFEYSVTSGDQQGYGAV
jgi:hypothetical protein